MLVLLDASVTGMLNWKSSFGKIKGNWWGQGKKEVMLGITWRLARNFHVPILWIIWKYINSWDLHFKMLFQSGTTSVKCSQETSVFPFLEPWAEAVILLSAMLWSKIGPIGHSVLSFLLKEWPTTRISRRRKDILCNVLVSMWEKNPKTFSFRVC